MIRRFYWLFLLLAVSLPAQEEARLFFAQGMDFVVTTADGRRTIYQTENMHEILLGMEDMVQTGSDSTAEIRMSPSGVLIKILESTSLVYNGDTLEIIYGRIRVKIPEDARKGLFVQANTILVYMAKGDMGFDFVLDPATALEYGQSLSVYTLAEKGRLKFENIPELQINEHEIVLISTFPEASLVERRPLNANSSTYWNETNFKDAEPLSVPQREVVVLPSEQAPVIQGPLYGAEEYAAFRNKMKWKNTGFIVGSLLLTLGAASEVVSNYVFRQGNRSTSDIFTYVGYGFIFTGLAAVITAAATNPSLPPAPEN
ncbi:MAG: hypothetical protein LBK25_05090 [Treponema sp.]|jgi:hypothetical protein|nr:hypothetical protein [Treponema sp.]